MVARTVNAGGVMALRYWMGFVLLFGLAGLLMPSVYTRVVANDPHMTGALIGGLIAAAATAVGTIPAMLARQVSQRLSDTMMGFGAGVMLAATSFSLIVPALEVARDQGAGPWLASGIVGAGILVGALVLLLIDRSVPHEHFVKGMEGGTAARAGGAGNVGPARAVPAPPDGLYTSSSVSHATNLKRVWLFVMAIALHNFPEGLAIGVAFAGPDHVGARALAAGIAIQDVPEGLVVALALIGVGYSKRTAFVLAALTGLVEPIAAVFGVLLISFSTYFLPWGLAIAAGAMLFVISHEIIPESHRKGHETWATGGLIVGFILMMLLDTALG